MNWETIEQLQGRTEQLKTPTHLYVVFYDGIEKMFKVIYIDHATDKAGYKLYSSRELAKDWVENTHVPAKAIV